MRSNGSALGASGVGGVRGIVKDCRVLDVLCVLDTSVGDPVFCRGSIRDTRVIIG